MRMAYVFGPISVYGKQFLPIYKRVMSICYKYYDNVVGSYPDFWDSTENASEHYESVRNTIKNAHLLIGEFTKPSHGVGMEVQMSVEFNVPLIVIAEKGAQISRLVKGIPNLRNVIYYVDHNDLARKLESELSLFDNPPL